MAVNRGGPTPPFYEFPCKYRLSGGEPSRNIIAIAQTEIRIPRFQRGIEWDEEKCQSLVNSKSQLFGTAILANDPNDAQVFILLDGLQRFATATAILVSLYDLIIAENASKQQEIIDLFAPLIATTRGFKDVYFYNHQILRNSSRMIINTSYGEFYERINAYIQKELNESSNSFADKVCEMFLVKQVAVDTYTGFSSSGAINTTFRALNSESKPLTSADFIRSDLVDCASRVGWSASEIEEMEDLFSDLFDDKSNNKLIAPLSALIEDRLENIFPDWENFSLDQFNVFHDFVDACIENSIWSNRNTDAPFPYLHEISQCGGVPFSYTVLYYYLRYVDSEQNGAYLPDFVDQDNGISFTGELHLILRSIYRRVFDRSLGRLEVVGENVINRRTASARDLAEGFNPGAAGSLDSGPDAAWLTQSLRRTNLAASKRVFNACLLPDRDTSDEDDLAFSPFRYSRGRTNWTIDHLIPRSEIISDRGPGHYEGNTICNFAPCQGRHNSALKTNPCSWKLTHNSSPYRSESDYHIHPYHAWLIGEHVEEHRESLRSLDEKELLVVNAQPPIGDRRLLFLVEQLSNKL